MGQTRATGLTARASSKPPAEAVAEEAGEGEGEHEGDGEVSHGSDQRDAGLQALESRDSLVQRVGHVVQLAILSGESRDVLHTACEAVGDAEEFFLDVFSVHGGVWLG